MVTRIASVALTLTGLSPEVANFQARSAFTGVGFTTTEAEKVINHPVRRKIITSLMFVGNLGIAAVIATSMISFSESAKADQSWFVNIAVLAVGALLLWIVFSSRVFDRYLSKVIEWMLKTWTKIDVSDYVSLLQLSRGYVVVEIKVNPSDWIAEKTLADLNLSAEGILVLGIHRSNGKYVGSPNGTIIIHSGDLLSVYGPIDRVEELNIREKGESGDVAHAKAISQQDEIITTEVREQERSDDEEDPLNPSDQFKNVLQKDGGSNEVPDGGSDEIPDGDSADDPNGE